MHLGRGHVPRWTGALSRDATETTSQPLPPLCLNARPMNMSCHERVVEWGINLSLKVPCQERALPPPPCRSPSPAIEVPLGCGVGTRGDGIPSRRGRQQQQQQRGDHWRGPILRPRGRDHRGEFVSRERKNAWLRGVESHPAEWCCQARPCSEHISPPRRWFGEGRKGRGVRRALLLPEERRGREGNRVISAHTEL